MGDSRSDINIMASLPDLKYFEAEEREGFFESSFPKNMNCVTADDYDIAGHYPDVIVTQYPYDGRGVAMDDKVCVGLLRHCRFLGP